ncbi:hypothetical protein SODG_007456 [Sodalis praecaptivus]
MQRLAALILAAFNAAVKRAIGQYFVRSLVGFFIEPRLDCGQAAFWALFCPNAPLLATAVLSRLLHISPVKTYFAFSACHHPGRPYNAPSLTGNRRCDLPA